MSTSIEKTIQRIKRFSLNCTLNDNGHVRHFHYGHEYVEIGGIKWATYNVGAEKPTDSGLYFAWGETKGFTASQIGTGEGKVDMSAFQTSNHTYKYWSGRTITKYNGTDGLIELELEDDAATVNMGVGWRIPTRNEFKALFASSTSEWVTNYKGSGVNGRLFTDKTDSCKRLFFPAASFCADGSVGDRGFGFYWSSSLYSSSVDLAWLLYFNGGDAYWDNCCSRYYGFAIRGIVAE